MTSHIWKAKKSLASASALQLQLAASWQCRFWVTLCNMQPAEPFFSEKGQKETATDTTMQVLYLLPKW